MLSKMFDAFKNYRIETLETKKCWKLLLCFQTAECNKNLDKTEKKWSGLLIDNDVLAKPLLRVLNKFSV